MTSTLCSSPSSSTGSLYCTMPLMVADVFAFEGRPDCHVALRSALGQRGGREGFAAAALSGRVSFGQLHQQEESALKQHRAQCVEYRSIVPLSHAATAYVVQADGAPLVTQLEVIAAAATVQPGSVDLTVRTNDCETSLAGYSSNALSKFTCAVRPDPLTFVSVTRERDAPVQRIPNHFCCECTLSRVDLAGLKNVRQVGRQFLHQCTTLTSVNLSSFTDVEHVGSLFMACCDSLTRVDLSHMKSVRTMGKAFMQSCGGLVSANIAGFGSAGGLQTIDEYCFSACPALTTVDASGLASVTTIMQGFLCGCRSLRRLDLSGMAAVDTIGSQFLLHVGMEHPIIIAVGHVSDVVEDTVMDPPAFDQGHRIVVKSLDVESEPWLQSLPVDADVRALLIASGVTEESFFTLGNDRLKGMGIAMGPRKLLLRAIAAGRPSG